ncbi:MAG: TetR/AcrR family transcriptional regulator [Lacisediminihabitans sp.]
MTATSTRGPYRKGVETRERAIQAAIRLFSDAGYLATSMREIAASAGITHTGLQHYFPGKPALLTAVLEHRDHIDTEALRDELAAGMDYLTALVHMTQRNALRRPIVELFATLAAEATSPDHPAHEYFVNRYRSTILSTNTALEAAAARGELRAGVDIPAASRAIIAMMDGLQLQWLYATDPSGAGIERADMSRDLKNFFALILVNGHPAGAL